MKIDHDRAHVYVFKASGITAGLWQAIGLPWHWVCTACVGNDTAHMRGRGRTCGAARAAAVKHANSRAHRIGMAAHKMRHNVAHRSVIKLVAN